MEIKVKLVLILFILGMIVSSTAIVKLLTESPKDIVEHNEELTEE